MAAPECQSEHSWVLPRDGGGGPGAALRVMREVVAHARRGLRGAGPCATASSCEVGWWVAMWLRRRGVEMPSASASEGCKSSAAWTEMGSWVRTIGGRLKQRLRLDVGREICRQYPLFCFLLLCLSAASLLLNRYLRLALRRPLESPQTVLGGGQERTRHSGFGRGGRCRARICGRERAGGHASFVVTWLSTFPF